MIRVILANATVECELTDLSAVMATINPGKLVERKLVEPVSAEPVKVPEPVGKVVEVKIRTCAEVFHAWNISDMASDKVRRQWYGCGAVKVYDNCWIPSGFLSFLGFLQSRNPGRAATQAQLWELFRFMPWTESTFVQNMCTARHRHGWTYANVNGSGVYIANK